MSKENKEKHTAETHYVLKSHTRPSSAGRDCKQGYQKKVPSECHAFRLQEEQAMKEK